MRFTIKLFLTGSIIFLLSAPLTMTVHAKKDDMVQPITIEDFKKPPKPHKFKETKIKDPKILAEIERDLKKEKKK